MSKNTLKEIRGIYKTQKDFAKELGISQSLYEKYERGERTPSNKFLRKLKSLYPNIDLNNFFN